MHPAAKYTHDLEQEFKRTHDSIPFVQLIGGQEPQKAVEARWTLYQQAWKLNEQRIDAILKRSNAIAVEKVAEFINEEWDSDPEARVAAGILLPGSNVANHTRLFSQVHNMISQHERTIMASLNSKECPNLKSALKLLVMRLTEDPDAASKAQNIADDDEDDGDDMKFDKRLRYDLDILVDFCRKQAKLNDNIKDVGDLRVVISIEDADSFDIGILSGLVRIIQSYVSVVPFKLILSVATSLRVFEDKLPRQCVRMLKGTAFQAGMGTEIFEVLDEVVFTGQAGGLMLGPKLFKSLMDRQTQSMESVDAFVATLKFVFMSHFYSNPFSIAYSPDFGSLLAKEHIAAVRLLGSFKNLVEAELENKRYDDAKRLLEDDAYLLSLTVEAVDTIKNYWQRLLGCIDLLVAMRDVVRPYTDKALVEFTKASLYPVALSGQLAEGGQLDAFFRDIERMDLKAQMAVVETVRNRAPRQVDLENFVNDLSSELQDDLASQKTGRFLNRVHEFIKDSFASYRDQFFYESMVPDNAQLQESVFVPTYRGALELALSDPEHYLGSSLRDNNLFEPPVVILYRLYRESSLYINIYDYYVAFKESIPAPSPPDPDWDRRVLAWFLQGVSDLKFIGLMRDSKRKFESVEKLVWKNM